MTAEKVQGELVDYVPSGPIPNIKKASPDSIPDKPVKAPVPEDMFRHKKLGARRKYASPEQMQEVIDRYFASCVRMATNEETGRPSSSGWILRPCQDWRGHWG